MYNFDNFDSDEFKEFLISINNLNNDINQTMRYMMAIIPNKSKDKEFSAN